MTHPQELTAAKKTQKKTQIIRRRCWDTDFLISRMFLCTHVHICDEFFFKLTPVLSRVWCRRRRLLAACTPCVTSPHAQRRRAQTYWRHPLKRPVKQPHQELAWRSLSGLRSSFDLILNIFPLTTLAAPLHLRDGRWETDRPHLQSISWRFPASSSDSAGVTKCDAGAGCDVCDGIDWKSLMHGA